MSDKSETAERCGWHRRMEFRGYHIAMQFGRIAWPVAQGSAGLLLCRLLTLEGVAMTPATTARKWLTRVGVAALVVFALIALVTEVKMFAWMADDYRASIVRETVAALKAKP